MSEVIIKDFPCSKLGYCPYGVLVEQSEFREVEDEESCPIFGHQCPVFEFAEGACVNPKVIGDSTFA